MSETRQFIILMLLVWCALSATYQLGETMMLRRSCVSALQAIDTALKESAR